MRMRSGDLLRWCVVVVFAMQPRAYTQSLTDKLSEEESFYRNYGKETYSKLKIEKDKIGLYDEFGEHVTDGVHLYDLRNRTVTLSSNREGVKDSMLVSESDEFQKKDFFEKFSNLVITQDAIGGTKSSFLVGDQITTKFSPLTFNKTNFRGIRWDLWSTQVQFSALLSRTRPGFLAKKERDGSALVQYPLSPESFPSEYYNDRGPSVPGGIVGRNDFSHKSPYGDYDWLWAMHGRTNVAGKVDVGASVINHHRSDVRKGEKWFSGDVPREWMPEAIHFEFFDATPLNRGDAGVYVRDVRMRVNGRAVEAMPQHSGRFRRVFVGSQDSILLPGDLPFRRAQTGHVPIIVEFKMDPQFWRYVDGGTKPSDISGIKSVAFSYTIAGNYLVFASTSKQIPLAIKGTLDQQTDEVEYEHIDKSVEDIYFGSERAPIKIGAESESWFPEGFSTTYFGEYIRKSPKLLSMKYEDFDAAVQSGRLLRDSPRNRETYNLYTYTYRYDINISSVTAGIDFNGELGGVDFSGELAMNQREDKLPGSDESRRTATRLVGTFRGEKELGKQFGLSGDFYYISPDWQTNLVDLQTSRYFKETDYKMWHDQEDPAIKDYLVYPKPLGNNWNNIDDNDDGDAFVESDRRRYPSDLSNDDQGKFHADGTLNFQEAELVRLPSDMYITYDDPDGVIASKDDRNRNGVPDYTEDFLLFSADPPVFELGIDQNNNGVPDYEDDDILPDYWQGDIGSGGRHSVGYYVTADGIKTQGIQGLNLDLRWTPLQDYNVDFGVVAETVLDHDLNGIADAWEDGKGEPADFFDGKSFVGYINAQREVLKRSRGIQYDIGNELRLVRDAIRNDAITSVGLNVDGDYEVSYFYELDQLDYRQAVVDNIVGNITYTNIRNLEYSFHGKLGAQKRLPIDRDYYTEYSFFDPVAERTVFDSRWQPYHDRFIGELFLSKRLSYRIGFNNAYEDWRRVFNPLNRLEIIPQYKLSFFGSRELVGPTERDPRDLERHIRFDISGPEGEPDGVIDSTYDNVGDTLEHVSDARIAANEYRQNNSSIFLNVPLLRANYKIAENTQFQLGMQWLRTVDFITPEANSLGLTTVGQIVSRANYKGYNVTLHIGAKWYRMNYDINFQDPVLLQTARTGRRFDRRGWEFFAQIFSGT